MKESRPPKRLGDLLVDANLIDEVQLGVALQEQEITRERLGSTMVHMGFIDELVLAAFLSKQADLPIVNIQGLSIPPDVISLIPKELALNHTLLPIRKTDDTLYVALADPFDYVAVDKIADYTQLKIAVTIAPEFRLKKCLEHAYKEKFYPEEPMDPVSSELSNIAHEMETDTIDVLSEKIDGLTREIHNLAITVAQLKTEISSNK